MRPLVEIVFDAMDGKKSANQTNLQEWNVRSNLKKRKQGTLKLFSIFIFRFGTKSQLRHSESDLILEMLLPSYFI